MKTRKLFLICYDIRHPSRQRRVLKAIRGYAANGQKSVYECWVTESERNGLYHDVDLLIDSCEDQVGFIEIDNSRTTRVLGCANPPAKPVFFYGG